MLIKKLSIKNFKSYGNSPQTIELNKDNGELILLVGNNGAGKSTFLKSFEYTLYGKCTGSKKKWSTLSTLPNRINGGDMEVDIEFESDSTEIKISRGISPNKLEMWENGILNDRAGKSNIDNIIENYVGMDIETFKSFISLSINDFKNFISLSNEEKKILLDRLFNLEVINILAKILKELNKVNKNRSASLDTEIRTIEDSIASIERSIQKTIDKNKENNQKEINELTDFINSKKGEFMELKSKKEKVATKENEINQEIESEREQYMSMQNSIRNIQKEIDLYNQGKCPTCSTDFNSNHFLDLKNELNEKKATLEKTFEEIKANVASLKQKKDKLNEIKNKVNTLYNDLSYSIKSHKSKIEQLKAKANADKPDDASVEEFNKTIEELNKKKEVNQDSVSVCRDKELYYKELNRILGEDGAKKAIISSIVKPINKFISDNIECMNIPFEVILDETFSAEIKSKGVPIDHDTLSTGETKKINIAILIAYLKLIRTKKHINILFLDEVFSSIDLDGIDSILTLLKNFSNEYNINIFVVHHALLAQEMFDKILVIEKGLFSTINEIKYEEDGIQESVSE